MPSGTEVAGPAEEPVGIAEDTAWAEESPREAELPDGMVEDWEEQEESRKSSEALRTQVIAACFIWSTPLQMKLHLQYTTGHPKVQFLPERIGSLYSHGPAWGCTEEDLENRGIGNLGFSTQNS